MYVKRLGGEPATRCSYAGPQVRKIHTKVQKKIETVCRPLIFSAPPYARRRTIVHFYLLL